MKIIELLRRSWRTPELISGDPKVREILSETPQPRESDGTFGLTDILKNRQNVLRITGVNDCDD